MNCEKFIEKKFKPESLNLIHKINTIIFEYKNQGYELTLRQIYYQLVARAIIPNNERSYKNTGNLINDARLAGLVSWDAIVDRTRNIRMNSHWSSPLQIIQSAMRQYQIDMRITQPVYIEVWVEKDALISIVEDACSILDVPCFSCRGYVSQSEMYEASKRFIKENRKRENCILLHLGDHDPSGKDMTRDIDYRLLLFGAKVDVQRIALNYDQIEYYAPPANPTKLTDSRANQYMKDYGDTCWELDALEPKVIEELIKNKIAEYTDFDLLSERQRQLDQDFEWFEKIKNIL